MPVNPDIIFILLYFQKKVYRQSEPPSGAAVFVILPQNFRDPPTFF